MPEEQFLQSLAKKLDSRKGKYPALADFCNAPTPATLKEAIEKILDEKGSHKRSRTLDIIMRELKRLSEDQRQVVSDEFGPDMIERIGRFRKISEILPEPSSDLTEEQIYLLPSEVRSYAPEPAPSSAASTTNPAIELDEIGDDRLKTGEKLGKGEFGDVLRGTLDDEAVAVKLMSEKHQNEEDHKNFIAEGRIGLEASKTGSPHIVNTKQVCTDKDKSPMIITEIANRGDLKKCVRHLHKTKQIAGFQHSFIQQTFKGVSALHSIGYVHRDIAMRNFLVHENKNGEIIVKLADFGLTQKLDEKGLYHAETITGPIKWMSPGQIQKGISSEYSDLWSLAITMSEVVTGRAPNIRQNNQEYRDNLLRGKQLPGLIETNAAPELRAIQELLYLTCLHNESKYGKSKKNPVNLAQSFLKNNPGVHERLKTLTGQDDINDIIKSRNAEETLKFCIDKLDNVQELQAQFADIKAAAPEATDPDATAKATEAEATDPDATAKAPKAEAPKPPLPPAAPPPHKAPPPPEAPKAKTTEAEAPKPPLPPAAPPPHKAPPPPEVPKAEVPKTSQPSETPTEKEINFDGPSVSITRGSGKARKFSSTDKLTDLFENESFTTKDSKSDPLIFRHDSEQFEIVIDKKFRSVTINSTSNFDITAVENNRNVARDPVIEMNMIKASQMALKVFDCMNGQGLKSREPNQIMYNSKTSTELADMVQTLSDNHPNLDFNEEGPQKAPEKAPAPQTPEKKKSLMSKTTNKMRAMHESTKRSTRAEAQSNNKEAGYTPHPKKSP